MWSLVATIIINTLAVIALAVLGITISIDLTSHIRREWVHWLGILMILTEPLMESTWMFWELWNSRPLR
ncbi:MAG: hypothetical protein AAGJ83_11695 [Planctomycetota bacterium]